jgi:hypothetical protein
MLPNFLVIGTTKGGTTSLYRYLLDHPQIFMPRDKEPRFFTSNWDRGLDWYERIFDKAGDAVAVGEASPEYTSYPQFPEAAGRVAKMLPDVRLVYLVRHPIERMLSEYHYHMIGGKKGYYYASRPKDWASAAARYLLEEPRYRDISRYAMQIEQYLEHFSRDQLLVLKSEDLKRDRRQTLRRVYEFLGVDGTWQPPHLEQDFQATSELRPRRAIDPALRKVPGYDRLASVAPPSLVRLKNRLTTRKAPSRPRLSDSARRELEDRVRDDVRRLRRYMDDDFDAWGFA